MALYPPIVASSMPAFDVNLGKVRIYYTLSTYNALKKDEIKFVHVSVRRQSSNVNVLKNENQIIEKEFGLQSDLDKTLSRYYIEISNEDLKEGEPFEVDALYKVQLRFSSNSFNNTNFYTSNINSISEWSTVCIIKPIQIPVFYIDDFYTGKPPKESDINNFYYSLADFVGIYKQEKSSQTLKNWRIRLLQSGYTLDNITSINDYILADSGWILNNVKNYNLNTNSLVLSCSLPYQLKQDEQYKLLFEIQTKNGYEDSVLYNFTCNLQNLNTLSGQLQTYVNEQQGYIKLDFSSDEIYMGNLVIRRSDMRSNFLKWEDLKYFEIHNNIPNFTYYDFTAQSGLLYQYLVQKIDARGRRGIPVYNSSRRIDSGVMGEWEHAFLLESTGNGDIIGTKQLKLKYDFQISSYKTNISQNKTDTIGSKYPFIRRNGNMYYRSFPISGTITEFMDETNLFTNSEDLFNGHYEDFKMFKGQIEEYINQYDYTYERKFREKVEEFLYNSKPKLYKSMQQGNIFIKLMDISLTPKNQLNRLVYNFSATAYQIDQASIKTFNNYNLIHVGCFNPNVFMTTTTLGQISSYDFQDNIKGNMFKAGYDIIGTGSDAAINSIAKHIKFMQGFNNKIVTDFNINWIRLTMESQPYLIIEQNGRYRPYDDISQDGSDLIDFTDPINYPLYQIQSTYNKVNVYLGWLFEINNQQIIISPPNNIYEINEETFVFPCTSKIIPAKDTAMLVDFRLINIIEEDLSKLPKNIRVHRVNGQLIGTYDSQTELISRIKYKYSFKYQQERNKIERYVNGVNTVLVDAQPGTIVQLKTSVMQTAQHFIINETGQLNFDPNDPLVTITYLKVIGRNIEYDENMDLGLVDSLDSINPKVGQIVTINNQMYYYIQSKWFKAKRTGQKTIEVYCPTDAIIFYYISVREDIY